MTFEANNPASVSRIFSASRWRLDGRTAIVTGGSKGIGRGCVLELLALGARVLVVARGESSLNDLRSELTSNAAITSAAAVGAHQQSPVVDRFETLSADLSTAEGVERVVARARELFGGSLDILVNNVGTNVRKKAIEYTEAEYHKVLSTNLESTFMLSVKLHDLLRRSATGGSVVCIGSVAGITAMRTGVPYAMTKAAMIQMCKNLAGEWAGDNIRVNCVAPWYIRTPLVAPVLSNETFMNEVIARTPMKRVGEIEEISGVVAFLCMTPSSFVTGQTMSVDGGMTVYTF
ncbi:tropinone reductase [Capsaspora owczarzaki ATCC 30864]|uniref:Tropinone reductase n=1 Tax=Capsaspora owczarzaki (strain ATCC 30864) TaxID=595528 RepID=A0A0D2WTW4_CAPO3|nr:tropinone reductase [Capsaspora owczarzaki ATCC 30864]KJE96005.1 tropinone reductase [Capsaspora owczarzaki ATCC 30864]|eukprot:XP_004345129.2 tropinone reductase [Capsaspora owczarzaki ATCC 30864]